MVTHSRVMDINLLMGTVKITGKYDRLRFFQLLNDHKIYLGLCKNIEACLLKKKNVLAAA